MTEMGINLCEKKRPYENRGTFPTLQRNANAELLQELEIDSGKTFDEINCE
jgi:hypothetical protein